MKKNLFKILVLCIAICSAVCLFTACSGVEFKINFMVDGEIYATVNTNGAETIKMPNNPVKNDYTFDGWFWDNGTWAKPFTANSLLDTPLSSDMSVYCKWKEDAAPMERAEIVSANGFTFDGNNGKISVSNDTGTYSFINQIQVNAKATWVISTDISGLQTVATKTIPLDIGNNIVYLLVTSGDGNNINLYTMTVRRRPIYTVSFNTDGGTAVINQQIEEGSFAIEPTTERAGYTFTGWNRNFNEPIDDNIIIKASWVANTDTPYKVEYYLENLNNGYNLDHTDILFGTTDTVATATIKSFNHYNHITFSNSIESAKINGAKNTTLKVYYVLESFNVYVVSDTGVNLIKYYGGTYKYGTILEGTTAELKLGYDWKGWYNNDEFMTNDYAIQPFTVEQDITYTARSDLKNEMENFSFTSTATTCTVFGVKDKSITELTVPNYVTQINEGAFSGCSFLQSITVPFVGGSIKNARDAFQYPFGYIFGTSLYTGGMEIRQFYYGSNTSSITGTTYYIPASLTKVIVAGGNILYGAFYNFSNLTSVNIPNNVTNIGDYAFYGCLKLVEVYNKSQLQITAGSSDYGYAGYYAKNIYTPNNGESKLSTDNNGYIIYTDGLDKILVGYSGHKTDLYLPNEITEVYKYAFSCCNWLTSVIIPNCVTIIGEEAFSECSSLTNITISDSITSIGNNAFIGCPIENAKIPTIAISYMPRKYLKIVEITGGSIIGAYAFSGISSLISITIPDSVTSIGEAAFEGCSSLEEMTIPFVGNSRRTSTEKYQYPFGYIFGTSSYTGGKATTQWYYGSSTSSITNTTYYIPRSLRTVNVTNGNILCGAFSACSNLTHITLPDDLLRIENYAFRFCSSLTNITIPDSVTSIGEDVFYNCESLLSITLSDNITSIGGYAFYGCSSLKEIAIPDSVISIGNNIFYDCNNLSSVTVGSSVERIGKYAFYNCNNLTYVIFRNVRPWMVSLSSTTSSDTVIQVSNYSTAANYLKETYVGYYWKRCD